MGKYFVIIIFLPLLFLASAATAAAPNISFVDPTDADGASIGRNHTYINVSTADTNNISAFIDFNRSLVLYLSLNNHTLDNSTYGNNGTFINGNGTNCDSSQTGQYGGACSFNGSTDYIQLPVSNSLNFSGSEVTVEAWVRSDAVNGARMPIVKVDNGTEIAFQMYEIHTVTQRQIRFYVQFADDTNKTILFAYHSGLAGAPRWFHLVGVYNRTDVLIYVNGLLRVNSSVTGTLNPMNGISNLTIANGAGVVATPESSTTKFFKGSLDEVRIWNRALNNQEINASYNSNVARLERNFTDLVEGTYEYYAFVTNLTGANSRTETRTLYPDFNVPQISFVAPTDANNTFVSRNHIYINVTTTDANAMSAFIDFNRSLLLYLSLNNHTLDNSTYGNNGTRIGNVNCTSSITGKYGSGCEVPSTAGNFINVSYSQSSNISSNTFTVELWLKRSQSTTQAIILKNVSFFIDQSGSSIRFNITNITGQTQIVTATDTTTKTFQHIAGVYNSTTIILYIDGVRRATASINGNIRDTSNPIQIGYDNINNCQTCVFDEVRIHKRALSDQEINASFMAKSYRLERNFTDLEWGNTYEYYSFVTDVAGKNNRTETRIVKTINTTVTITQGADGVVSAKGTQSANITATFYDVQGSFYPSGVSGKIWIEQSPGIFSVFSCTSNSLGNCTINFDPDCSYLGGKRTLIGGIAGDDSYVDMNSSATSITIDSEPSCTRRIGFSLRLNISGTASDSAEADGLGLGFYRSLENKYGCIQDTTLTNSPAFGLVFVGNTFDYINLTNTTAGYSIKLSQFVDNNRLIIPITKNGCSSIKGRMSSIKTLGPTQAFNPFGPTGNIIELSLLYPGIDIIGDFSRSGSIRISIEKNQSGNLTQLIVVD